MYTVEQNRSKIIPLTLYSISTGLPLAGLTFSDVGVNFVIVGSAFPNSLTVDATNFVEVDAILLPGCYALTVSSGVFSDLGTVYFQVVRNPGADLDFQTFQVDVVTSVQAAIVDPLADLITAQTSNVQTLLGSVEVGSVVPVPIYLSQNRAPITSGLNTLGVDYAITEYAGGAAIPATSSLVSVGNGIYTYTPSASAISSVGIVAIRVEPLPQWQLRNTSIPYGILDVSGYYDFGTNSHKLLAVSFSGQVTESTDTGETWTTDTNFPITPIQAFRASGSLNTGGSVVQVVAGDGNRFFYRTNPANPFVSFPAGSSSEYTGVTIQNETTIWTCSAAGVIKFFNGTTHTVQRSGGQLLNAIYALDTSNVWSVGNQGTAYKTNDGGALWTNVSALFGFTFDNFQDITFSNYGSGKGLIVGDSCWRTTDLGNSWTQIPLPDSNVYYAVRMADFNDKVWIFGTGGAIYFSADVGDTWVRQTTPDSVSTMFGAYISTDGSVGVAGGSSGQAWKYINPPTFDPVVFTYNVNPVLSDIRGAGFNPATDTLEQIRDSIGTPDLSPVLTSLNEMKGVGFDTATDSLAQVSLGLADLNSNLLGALNRVLGLTQENFRTFDHTYDANNALIQSKIRIYPSASDTNADTNPLAEYQMDAVYDVTGRLSDYRVIKTF